MSRYLASAALALCLCATAVQAQPRQMHVSLAGLDLSKPSDVQALNRRIHKAAVDVCGTAQYQPGQGINQFVEDRDTADFCVWEAETGARQQLAGLTNTKPDTQVAASGN